MDLKQIYESTIAGNAPKVKELVEQALADGTNPGDIITNQLIPAMAEVGDRFARNEFFAPHCLASPLPMPAPITLPSR